MDGRMSCKAQDLASRCWIKLGLTGILRNRDGKAALLLCFALLRYSLFNCLFVPRRAILERERKGKSSPDEGRFFSIVKWTND